MGKQETQTPTPKKKQKTSVSYTLKSFGNNTKKLKEAGYLDDGEEKTLNELKEKMLKKYLENEF